MADHNWQENTNETLRVRNLIVTSSGVLQETATVTAAVKDSAGAAMGGSPAPSNPITLLEPAGVKGTYEGILVDTAAMVAGDTGTVVFIANNGTYNVQWTETWVCRDG